MRPAWPAWPAVESVNATAIRLATLAPSRTLSDARREPSSPRARRAVAAWSALAIVGPTSARYVRAAASHAASTSVDQAARTPRPTASPATAAAPPTAVRRSARRRGRRPAALPTPIGRDDQHRPAGVLGDLVRHAPVDELLRTTEPARPDHDDGCVDLVGRVDDRLPRRCA